MLLYSVIHASLPSPRLRLVAGAVLLAIACALLIALIGDQLHFDNYRFLWRANVVEEIRSKATAGGQFPSVWTAFRNSLVLALSQTVIIITVASLAGYYISRFAFRGREAFLQGMLVLHAFPAMTLIIPIFLILYWVGLLDTIGHHDGEATYRLCSERHHHHLVCSSCRRVEELAECDLSTLEASVADQHGYRVEGHTLSFFGLCADCQEHGGGEAEEAAAPRGAAG